ncbi:Predicted N-acetyltransferase YhbS [Pseudosulfitobacter pseudonitzschiae]|nr:GNAT family N-acetyltransferase [Pseudosulfitobacter pseudonitzschiae]QKS10349.1 GNAT family N-acetyltransferase [Pseudosulfitobacter pseudonitzschiae]SHF54685.1 Predicted N-acetyltransferase YhbS [Pseudosulfitobacter pseudonitzschiae]
MQAKSGTVNEQMVKKSSGSAASAARYKAFMSRSMPADEERLMLDTYEATIRPITLADRPLMHELTVAVFWPHRAHDLDAFLSLGKGYIALDEIGRPIGSAMYFPMGSDFAMFGMMVTTPRLQALGAGGRLLRRILKDCEGLDLRLSATKSGFSLYESAGFETVGLIWQQQGVVRSIRMPKLAQGLSLRKLEASDRAAIHALDSHAYGANRPEVLDAMVDLSTGVVVERDGAVCGFAMMRPFGKGIVIGPVVAEDDQMAMCLCAPLIQQCEGRFVRLDTPQQSEHFKAFLSAAGMGVYDTVTEMHLGGFRRATENAQTYGLSSHSLG